MTKTLKLGVAIELGSGAKLRPTWMAMIRKGFAGLSALLWLGLTPLSGLAQDGWEDRELTLFDGEGNAVRTLREPARYWGPVISPDGARVAVIKPYGNDSWFAGDLWVYHLDDGDGLRIAEADPGNSIFPPVWSPNGAELAYITTRDGALGIYRTLSNGEGHEELLFEIQGGGLFPWGLTDWSRDGRTLLFLNGGNLYAYSLDNERRVDQLVARAESLQLDKARLSPSGGLIAYPSDESGTTEVWVRSVAISDGLDAAAPQKWQVSTDGTIGMIAWNSDGSELFYVNADLDVVAVEVERTPAIRFRSPRRVLRAPDRTPEAGVALSADGKRLVVALPPKPRLERISLLDRDGRLVTEVGPPGLYGDPALSPDGSRVAVLRRDTRTGVVNLWTFDVRNGEGRPITSDGAVASPPVWSPDGRVAYVAQRGDYAGVYRRSWDGAGDAELLYQHTPGASMWVDGFSADGRFLSITSGSAVYVVPLEGSAPQNRTARPVVQDAFGARGSRFAPDSRFLAFLSDESGSWDVYAQSFDAASGTPGTQRVQVSHDGSRGGIAWRHDGEEIYFLDGNRGSPGVMAVEVTTSPMFQAGVPSLLFRLPSRLNDPGQQIVSSDGQRFVFILPATEGDTPVRDPSR